MISEKDITTRIVPSWCVGCGNFGILSSLKRAIVNLVNQGLYKLEQFVLISGIGCHGKLTNYLELNSVHTIHGRVLPVATGIKLANPDLIVIGHAGDGDAYAIGIAHLIHTAKRNIPVVYIVHNNYRFGLTAGQVTPTTELGEKTRSTPYGNPEEPINPILLALSSGATFVARGFAGDVQHLTWLIEEAIKHRGFALIDVIQPCKTWDPIHTFEYWRERVYKLENTGHDPKDLLSAIRKAIEWNGKVPIGIFYRVEKPTLIDRIPQYKGEFKPVEVVKRSLAKLLEEFR
ncbi:MAG: thiamine pyrophosphate-dependent enzyme [Candidatus Korarchaeota archaeon]|nr:thiamine pyrophosphate-dependent enzyme [Thermoproteota archaeon]MCR8472271.1 thiamine pyrophosphate-dependent enzyme [Thermoproteota archaeon]MCR8488785.1 thiamine pyrophosphate-dependent enzyme [Thermoproteota archaeon]